MNLRLRAAVLTLLTPFVLAACTGSFEPPNPVLLVTGYQDAAGAKVALIRSTSNPQMRANRLTFLRESVRALPALAVSYDVTNREQARNAVVILSRSPATGPAGSRGFLTTFSLAGIDPDTPTAFAQIGAPLEINAQTFLPVPLPLRGQPLVFCPARLQVSQGGDYAAVLNTPSLCGLQAQPFIDILDLRGQRLLERLTGVGGVSSSGLYLSQSSTEDLLYYAVQAAGSLQLQRAVLPRPAQQFGINDTVATTLVTAVPTPAGQRDALDLQRAGADTEERLVFLFQDSLINVTEFGTGGTAQVSAFIQTRRNNAFVIRDDNRGTEGTFVVSTPPAGVLTYLPPPAEADTVPQQSARVSAVAAVTEPNRNLIYFVSNQQVALFDLAAFNPSLERLPDPAASALAVPELTAPSFVTWAQSVVPLAP